MLNFSNYFKVLIFLLIALIISYLFYYLIGQTPKQSRKEKLKIIGKNLYRLGLLSLANKVFGLVYCDVCLKKCNDGEVWYWQGKNSENFPYLNDYSDFHYGHSGCLSGGNKFKKDRIKESFELIKIDAKTYLKKKYFEVCDFYQKSNKYSNRSLSHKGDSEIKANNLFTYLNRFFK